MTDAQRDVARPFVPAGWLAALPVLASAPASALSEPLAGGLATAGALVGAALGAVALAHSHLVALWGEAAHFRTAERGRISLHYPPHAVRWVHPPSVARVCDTQLANVDRWFGRPRRFRVAVFFTRSERSLFGYGGWAGAGNTVAISLAWGDRSEAILRHEFAHLYGMRLNHSAPTLNAEGLAGLLEHHGARDPGKLGDRWTLRRLPPPLRSILHYAPFHCADREAERFHYEVAAHFAEHLVRRFGLRPYLSFYRRAGAWNFGRAFRRVYGISLSEAEAFWRAGLACAWRGAA